MKADFKNKKTYLKLTMIIIIASICYFLSSCILSRISVISYGNINNSRYVRSDNDSIFEQTIVLPKNVRRLTVKTLGIHNRPDTNTGVDLTIENDTQSLSRFFPICDLPNGQLADLTVSDKCLKDMDGNVTLKLTPKNLDKDNYFTYFFSDNSYDENTEDNKNHTVFVTQAGICPPFKLLFFTILFTCTFYIIIFKALVFFIDKLKNHHYIPIIVILILALLFTVAHITIKSSVNTGKPEDGNSFLVSGDTKIFQKICLNHTKNIIIYYHISENTSPGAGIEITLTQGNKKTTTVIPLSSKNRYMALSAHIDCSSFNNGWIDLQINGKDLNENDAFYLYKSILDDSSVPVPNISINDEEYTGQHLVLGYDYFNPLSAGLIYIAIIIILISAYYILCYTVTNFRTKPAIPFSIALLIISLLKEKTFSTELDVWSNTLWMLTYKYGFYGKALPGTLLRIFFRLFFSTSYISAEDLRYVYISFYLILSIILILFLNRISDAVPNEYRTAISSFIVIFISSPVFITFYSEIVAVGKLDIFINLLFILSCFLIISERFLFLIPVFAGMAVLSHQLFILTELPALILLMFYEWQCKKIKKFAFPCISTPAVCGSLALYIQFFSKIENYSFEEILTDIRTHTDANLSARMIWGENFINNTDFKDYYRLDFVDWRIIFMLITTIAAISPVLIVLFLTWKYAIRNEKVLFNKLCILFIALSPLAELYTFTANVLDQGRYIYFSLFAAFIVVFVLICKEDQNFLYAINKLEHSSSSVLGPSWAWITGAYLICLGNFNYTILLKISDELSRLADITLKLTAY